MMDYTVEIYKEDRRYHKGEKLVKKEDYTDLTKVELEKILKPMKSMKHFRYEIHETYVTKKNFATGMEFKERYDVPYFCSPSSETYWSM